MALVFSLTNLPTDTGSIKPVSGSISAQRSLAPRWIAPTLEAKQV